MFNKKQLKNLSQEELIELVLKTEKEKEEIQARFRGLSTIVINAFHNCKEVALLADKYLIAEDRWMGLAIEQQISHMLESLRVLAENSSSQFQALLGKGSEKIGRAEVDKELKENKGSWVNGSKELIEATRIVDQVVKSLPENTPLAGEFKSIVNEPAASIAALEKKPSLGRQKVNPKVRERTVVPASDKVPHCKGCTEEMIKLSSFVETIRRKTLPKLNNLEALSQRQDVYVCPKCGQAHVRLPVDAEHPVNCARTVGTSMLLELAMGLYSGIPLHRQIKELQQKLCLGHDTVSYNLHDLARFYLHPLALLYESSLKKADVLIADETVFPVLEAQGRGKCSKECMDETKLRKQNYLLALTTAASAPEQIFILKYLPSRSAQAISSQITSDFQFNTLVTDGYSAYETVLQALGGERKHQSCLIHYRRKLLSALLSSSLLKELHQSALGEKEKLKQMKIRVQQAEPGSCVLICVEALSKLYNLQEAISKEVSQRKQEEYRRRQDSLLTAVDKIMSYQADKICMKTQSGLYKKGVGGGLYSAACAYYMNLRNEFKVFIDDFKVPADSNLVESRLRPVTVLRKNIWYKQSVEYAVDMCDIYSIFKTLELNGIAPVEYLKKYCRSVYGHVLDKAWTEALKDGHDKTKKIGSLDFKHGLEDYDLKPWLPSTYKQLQAES